MFTESLKTNRGKALEEAFFFRMDQELIELLSRKLQRDEKIRSFAEATGIHDVKRLESLVDAGFEMPTLTAFIWVPLVFVAWADGNVDAMEKKTILDVLATKGFSENAACRIMDHEWVRNPPNADLWKIWEDFSAATLANLKAPSRNELIDEIVGLCYVVAHASGGFLGIGKVSPSETEVIDHVIESLQACDGDVEA
jgi:hypothetical protein